MNKQTIKTKLRNSYFEWEKLIDSPTFYLGGFIMCNLYENEEYDDYLERLKVDEEDEEDFHNSYWYGDGYPYTVWGGTPRLHDCEEDD